MFCFVFSNLFSSCRHSSVSKPQIRRSLTLSSPDCFEERITPHASSSPKSIPSLSPQTISTPSTRCFILPFSLHYILISFHSIDSILTICSSSSPDLLSQSPSRRRLWRLSTDIKGRVVSTSSAGLTTPFKFVPSWTGTRH